MQLHEKYRPATLKLVVGQSDALARIRAVTDRRGFEGGAFWIAGPSGVGKTTIARCLANKFCKHSLDVQELDGDSCTADAVRQFATHQLYASFGGGFRAVIVNEAQAITSRAVQAWLTVLEKLRPKTLVIFTSTDDTSELFGDYSNPFMSRCFVVKLTRNVHEAFALHAQRVAKRERLGVQPIDAYRRLVAEKRGNLRAVLQAIEMGVMNR